MIHVVHHPDYVTPAPARSTYRWNKNGLIRDLLRAHGSAVAWHEPRVTPHEWLEAVHEPDYVAEVLETRVQGTGHVAVTLRARLCESSPPKIETAALSA